MKRILITDDSVAQRLILANMVKGFGYEVEMAVNGREAIEQIVANPPDCLLLDSLMPEMTGVEVLEALKARGIAVPTIMLTADVQDWLKARCLDLGVAVFLNKPAKIEKLKLAFETVFSVSVSSESPGWK